METREAVGGVAMANRAAKKNTAEKSEQRAEKIGNGRKKQGPTVILTESIF